MKIKVLSLFSGIGAFETALDRLNIEYELVNYCEIDKYASKAYSAIHNVSEELNLWDVSKVDTSRLPKDIDLLTHGSPCQDFSIAGRGQGGDKGSGTRSSLMYETLRIVKDIHPRVVIWENVKNLLSQKHRHNFEGYLETMRSYGYVNYYKVLNAKDYGIPQNRERVFTLSISKDLDEGFEFPKPMQLDLRLKDMLEEEVDEKFYLNDEKVCKLKIRNDDTFDHTNRIMQIGNCVNSSSRENPNGGRVYSTKGISPTLGAMQGGGLQPHIVVGEKERRIRKITPKECWRLMGFTDEDFEKVQNAGLSNTQLYKQAGNSIVVNVLVEIFRNLYLEGVPVE